AVTRSTSACRLRPLDRAASPTPDSLLLSELTHDEVAFHLRLRRALVVAPSPRLLDVIVDFGETAAVRDLRVLVEDLARIAEERVRQLLRQFGHDSSRATGFSGDEVEHVELPTRCGEKARDVPHALDISQHRGPPAEHDRP